MTNKYENIPAFYTHPTVNANEIKFINYASLHLVWFPDTSANVAYACNITRLTSPMPRARHHWMSSDYGPGHGSETIVQRMPSHDLKCRVRHCAGSSTRALEPAYQTLHCSSNAAGPWIGDHLVSAPDPFHGKDHT